MNVAMLIDIGNSRTKLARWSRGKLQLLQAVPTEHLISGRTDIAHFLSQDDEAVAVSSVVPDALPAVTAAVAAETDSPLRLATLGATTGAGAEKRLTIPVQTNVDEPARVGTDRLLAALAAHRRFARPLVIVGFGSALTLDCVSADGVFLGGLIFPGSRMCAKALAAQTAALPEVDVTDTAPVIGRNTEEAIRAGIFRGIVNAVCGTVRELAGLLGDRCEVVATGGGGAAFAPHIPEVAHLEEHLVLEGLAACLVEESR